jgi:hypothetical protein
MPPKKIFLLVLAFVTSVLLVRIGLKIYGNMKASGQERELYAQQLRYDFSMQIDTLSFLSGNAGPGKVAGKITRGTAIQSREDSLANSLKHFDRLYFNESKTPGSVRFVMPGADRFQKNDSIVVNSYQNEIKFFRNGSLRYEDKLSNLLEQRRQN